MRKTLVSVRKNPGRVLSISRDQRHRAKPVVAYAFVRKNPSRVLSISRDQRRRAKLVVAYAFVSAVALLGCGNNNFNTPQLLKTPRVLAIQAEPPQPSFGTSTTLRALIYLPPVHSDAATCAGVDSAAQYQWSWCPVPTSSSDGYKCHLQQATVDALAQQLGLGQTLQLDPATGEIDLGTGETATLTNPFPAQILDGLCTGAIDLSPRPDAGAGSATSDGGPASICDQSPSGQPRFGYPVTITLRYTPPCGSPPQDNFGPTLTTVFTVLLPRDDSTPGNQNPIIGGIQATWGGAPDGGTASVDMQTEDISPVVSPAEIDAGESGVDAETSLDAGSASDVAGSSPTKDAAELPAETTAPTYGVLLDDAFSTTVPRQERIKLHAQIPKASSENLPPAQADAIDIANNPDMKPDGTGRKLAKRSTERLDLRWYAEAGDFGSDGEGGYRTGFFGFPDDIDSLFSHATDNQWTVPKSEDYAPNKARLIVVVTDNRGGVTWTTGSASLELKP
jgi:hypothetical protein